MKWLKKDVPMSTSGLHVYLHGQVRVRARAVVLGLKIIRKLGDTFQWKRLLGVGAACQVPASCYCLWEPGLLPLATAKHECDKSKTELKGKVRHPRLRPFWSPTATPYFHSVWRSLLKLVKAASYAPAMPQP